MKFSLIRPKLFLSLFFIVLLAPLPALAQRLHPRLKEPKPGVEPAVLNRIVVLPAQVSLVMDGMKGAEPLEKEAAAAAPIIEQAVAKALASKNITTLDSPFTPAALVDKESVKYALADLQRSYNEVLTKLGWTGKSVEKGRFTLGDQVLLLNQDDHIDAFVFVHAFGVRKTGGKKALAILTLNPLMLMPMYSIGVGVVDARNGDLLAYSALASIIDIGKPDDTNLVKMLTRSLKKLPGQSSVISGQSSDSKKK